MKNEAKSTKDVDVIKDMDNNSLRRLGRTWLMFRIEPLLN